MSIKYKYKKVEDSDKNLTNINKQINIWHKDFSKSHYFELLSEEERNDAHFVISTFTEMMYNYCDEFPDEWSEEAMEEILCDLFPRKISAKKKFYKNVENILTAFFLFFDIEYLKTPLAKYCRVMVKKSEDSNSWGMAKQFVMSAMDSGVDLHDKEAMNQFMEEYNKAQRAKHNEKKTIEEGLKVGRNDPCPCGSGLKYKTCCGR